MELNPTNMLFRIDKDLFCEVAKKACCYLPFHRPHSLRDDPGALKSLHMLADRKEQCLSAAMVKNHPEAEECRKSHLCYGIFYIVPLIWAGKRRAHSDPHGPFVTFSTPCPGFFKVVPKSLVFPHTNHVSLVSLHGSHSLHKFQQFVLWSYVLSAQCEVLSKNCYRKKYSSPVTCKPQARSD